jgi:hypothetical protein
MGLQTPEFIPTDFAGFFAGVSLPPLLDRSLSGKTIWRKRRPGPPAEGARSDGLRLRLTHKLMRRQIMLFIPW